MISQTTTVYGLPGVGKSTYCKTLAYKGVGNGLGTWRPEPTADILELYESYTDAQVQEIIQKRFLYADLHQQPNAHYRDSDGITSALFFSKTPTEDLDLKQVPANLLKNHSTCLIYLTTSLENQIARIKARAAEEGSDRRNYRYELAVFCTEKAQERANKVLELHPAATKICLPV